MGVIGPGDATVEQAELAQAVGKLLGESGHVVLNGGLGGVMEAASRGARLAGATVVGLLPGSDRFAGNKYLTVALPTGLGELRPGPFADNRSTTRRGHGRFSPILVSRPS